MKKGQMEGKFNAVYSGRFHQNCCFKKRINANIHNNKGNIRKNPLKPAKHTKSESFDSLCWWINPVNFCPNCDSTLAPDCLWYTHTWTNTQIDWPFNLCSTLTSCIPTDFGPCLGLRAAQWFPLNFQMNRVSWPGGSCSQRREKGKKTRQMTKFKLEPQPGTSCFFGKSSLIFDDRNQKRP